MEFILNTSNPSQNDIDDCYMNLVRNVKRNYWFIAFNFGGSPCFHESFIDKRSLAKRELTVDFVIYKMPAP
ncbi:MAG: hypothetical protein CM15mP127_00260 [Gammaproteobacteria bacterium]|nr:MAG: hypothetical protein CM15mP127_00260 [Gammaproteobacteria bacterium]